MAQSQGKEIGSVLIAVNSYAQAANKQLETLHEANQILSDYRSTFQQHLLFKVEYLLDYTLEAFVQKFDGFFKEPVGDHVIVILYGHGGISNSIEYQHTLSGPLLIPDLERSFAKICPNKNRYLLLDICRIIEEGACAPNLVYQADTRGGTYIVHSTLPFHRAERNMWSRLLAQYLRDMDAPLDKVIDSVDGQIKLLHPELQQVSHIQSKGSNGAPNFKQLANFKNISVPSFENLRQPVDKADNDLAAIRPSGQLSILAHNDPLEIEAFFGNPAPNNPSNQPSAQDDKKKEPGPSGSKRSQPPQTTSDDQQLQRKRCKPASEELSSGPEQTKANLAGRPSTEDLISISRATGRKRKDLLRSLGIEETTIETLFDDNPNNAEEACYQGLRIWENENALKPVTWGTLIHALKMTELTKLANELLHKVNPQQQQERSPVALYQGGSGKPPAEFPSRPEQTKTLCDNPHIQDLKRHVMRCYKILKPSKSKVRVEYVQLALLEAHDEDEEEMMKHKKGGGKKMDFLESFRSCGLKSGKVREFIDVADLLKPTSDPANRMTVVYGQAGIGKTTMLTHICRSLALDKMKSSYALVLYFPLRDKELVSSAKTLSDLLSYYATADSDLDLPALRRAIVNSGDKEVLFIFDGADEVQDLLSSEERGVFQKFLEGRTLPQADVIVSSRPGGLPQLMEQNLPTVYYEIHGLPMLSIEKYINDFFKSRPEKGERLWKELQSREDLMGAAHIPMNLLIFCHIFRKGGLPSTLTDCYKLYIVEVHNRESPEKKWKCFDQCSKDVEQLLFSLGRLAYNGLMSTPSTFVFEEEKVKKAFKTTSLDKSTFKGLLHEHPSIYEVYSNNSTYNFSHTTQQELFCAYYISHLPVGEQIEFLRGNCSNRKFSMVLRFYAGLTGLVDEQVVHTVLHEPGFFHDPFLPQASTTGHSICARDDLRCDNDNPGLLHIFHFLYESQNSVLSQSVARHLDGKSIFFDLFLTSYDTRVIAHCLRESCSFSHLGFESRTLDSHDSEHVLSCVSSILMSDSVARIQKLILYLNRLTRTGGSRLKEGLSRTAVEVMSLTVKRADMSAIAAVFEASGLKTLRLNVVDVDSVSDSDLEVAQSTARNIGIKELMVGSLSSLRLLLSVVKGLAANTCVEKLVLQNIGASGGDDGSVGQALATACTTNTTLKDIGLNCVFPFSLMEVLCSRDVPLERLAIGGIEGIVGDSVSDSDLEVAQSTARNIRIKELQVESQPSLLLSVVKGLAANTCVEKLVLQILCADIVGSGDDGSVGQALATACTTNTTLKDIELVGVFPFSLMEVLCSRDVPLERLAIGWYGLHEDPSPCTPEALETLAQDMKVKRFESNWEWSTEDCKALADGLSRNKSLKEVDLNLRWDAPDDLRDYISAKLSTLETVKIHNYYL